MLPNEGLCDEYGMLSSAGMLEKSRKHQCVPEKRRGFGVHENRK